MSRVRFRFSTSDSAEFLLAASVQGRHQGAARAPHILGVLSVSGLYVDSFHYAVITTCIIQSWHPSETNTVHDPHPTCH